MKQSNLFTKTKKDAPAGEVAKNAQLLIRAGYVHKEMAGVYAYLPLGIRVIEKIKQIVREEMDVIGGQEMIMASMQKKKLWEKTNRWDDEQVDVWFKSVLKNGTEVGFGWSHEEPITDMMKSYLTSYRDLPAYAYQFQTKLRNELRAKSGIMRGREFVMKDMYSYTLNEEQHDAFYNSSIDAYMNVFNRVGLGDVTYVTFASGGAFTQYSHEFQTLTDAGEDTLFLVPNTKHVFNEEVAPSQAPEVESGSEMKDMEEVEGAGLIGVEPLAEFLGIPVNNTTKTMLFVTETKQVIAAAVRGGYSVNENKLKAVLGAESLQLADEETVKRITGAEVGYAGLMNLPTEVRIIVDESCENRVNFEMGANHTNFHSINVNWGRDLPKPEQYYDIKTALIGDIHPETGTLYEVKKAAEVGNIFNFGTVKCEQLGLHITDEAGVSIPVHLGSYGIGITRLMGVLVEHFSDDKGLVWPAAVAPFQVHLISLLTDDTSAVDALYEELTASGVEVLYDDRNARAGEKFADSDLLGLPTRVTIGKRSLESGEYEVTDRATGEMVMLTKDQLFERLSA